MHIESHPNVTGIIIHGAIAVFGGIANTIRCHPKSISAFVGNVFVASFIGVLFSLVGLHYFGDTYITKAITAAGGYMGVEGFNIIFKIILKSIKVNVDKCDFK